MLVKNPAKVLAHRGAHKTRAVASEPEHYVFPCGFCAVREDKLSRDWLV